MTRSRLLWPIGGLIVLFVLYGAYWFYASTQIRDGVNDWIAAQERAGYQIEHDGVRVGGFPYRFRIRLISPHVRAPESDGGWYAHLAALHADALPYDLSHWIVTFGGPFLLDDYIEPGSQLELNVSDARVSLVYGRDGDTERVGAEVRDFQVTTHAGRAPDIRAVEELILSGRVIEEDQLQVRLAVRGVTAAPGVLEPEVQRAFGDTASTARLAIDVSHWSALARGANAFAWRDSGGALRIVESELEWGPAHITGTGDFTIDSRARPDGRLSLRITDPDALADALVEAGIVPAENQEALRLAAMMAPRGPDGVSLPLRIHEGGIYLGPVRLGSLDG
jgi:hypothetical protein